MPGEPLRRPRWRRFVGWLWGFTTMAYIVGSIGATVGAWLALPAGGLIGLVLGLLAGAMLWADVLLPIEYARRDL